MLTEQVLAQREKLSVMLRPPTRHAPPGRGFLRLFSFFGFAFLIVVVFVDRLIVRQCTDQKKRRFFRSERGAVLIGWPGCYALASVPRRRI
jgi:hypothetical protein